MLSIAVLAFAFGSYRLVSRIQPSQLPVCFCRQHQMAIVKQVSGTAHTQYTQNLSDTDHRDCAPSWPGVKLKKLMLNMACSHSVWV